MVKRLKLHGWDDEKVYLWHRGKEYPISDDAKILMLLEKICVDFIEAKETKKRKVRRPIRIYRIETTEERMWAPGHFSSYKVIYFYVPKRRAYIEECKGFYLQRDKMWLEKVRQLIENPPEGTVIEVKKMDEPMIDHLLAFFKRYKTMLDEASSIKNAFDQECKRVLKGETPTGKNVGVTC